MHDADVDELMMIVYIFVVDRAYKTRMAYTF
jgi:hypothetical protein